MKKRAVNGISWIPLLKPKWFSSEMETKTRERQVKKYFDNLEECYQYIHPIYGEHYLKNGYLERRFYYGTEK